jgi:predicted TPR repeat methyltransferase
VLNLGSGCGLLDLALEFSGLARITAIDCDARVERAYRDAIERGLLSRTEFMLGSWDDIDQLADRRYDLILAWDALYYPGSDLFGLLPKLARVLSPSGVVIFDVRDARCRRVLGRVYDRLAARAGTAHYLCHDVGEVVAAARRDFDVVGSGPKLDSADWRHRLVRSVLAYAAGLSVGRYLVLSRRGAPPG